MFGIPVSGGDRLANNVLKISHLQEILGAKRAEDYK